MKIEQSTVTKIKLTEIKDLDPVTVILENYAPGKGKIIIECYGESWSSYWGAMSGDSIEEFFVRIDHGYAANNLRYMESVIDDFEAITPLVRQRIITKRRQGSISALAARELFNQEDWTDLVPTHPYDDWLPPSLVDESDFKGLELEEISIPQKPNPDYQYLCRIIENVQQGLKLYIDSKPSKEAA
ncbi:hypothetical protein Sps_05158 [Shewanella psychrophila]|uniref:Uncharacterized protein n=1 Tax=Shewanella psychrophila TaxID=225848 RepID=A0A1S6HXC8_9GAMM|nr:hypothetical protein [Shewanella psychrophila]AQS40227.1 hypothetical protein Sps_05158 [Shewanella psychrophila]